MTPKAFRTTTIRSAPNPARDTPFPVLTRNSASAISAAPAPLSSPSSPWSRQMQPAEYATFVGHQPEEREDPAERAIHDVHEAVARLWELVPPQTADWVVLTANIQADRKFRERSRARV